MSYRDHSYHSPSGTHPVGNHTKSGTSVWGLAVVLFVLLGLLGLAMMAGPADERGDQTGQGTTAPAVEQQAGPNAEQTAPAQPVE
ncbi:MAG: hypothetical protein ACU0B7_02070 [Paracoccaceae bacterium]